MNNPDKVIFVVDGDTVKIIPSENTHSNLKSIKIKPENDDWKNRYDKLAGHNIKLTDSLDRIAQELEELGVDGDSNDKNPIAG